MAKRTNPTIQQYNRIRYNLQRQIRSMISRGYFFEKPPLPPKPKKITEASVRRLKNIKENLYTNARYRTPEGTITSGKRGRYLERSRAGSKAAETRKYGKLPPDTVNAPDVIYDRLWDIIASMAAVHPNSSDYLRGLVIKELNSKGSDPAEQYKQQIRICRQFETAGVQHVEKLSVIAYYRRGTDAGQQAYNELILILSGGEIPTAEEMAERSAVFFEDEDGMLQMYDDLEPLPFE